MTIREAFERFVYDHPTIAAFAISVVAVSSIALVFSMASAYSTSYTSTHVLGLHEAGLHHHHHEARVTYLNNTSNVKINCITV
jgi:hypothetical protein